MKLISLTLITIFFSSTAMPQEKSSSVLYPWLSKSGKFGYCDSTAKIIIQPRFDHAQPFKNGYAVVGENGRYGIIDPAQKTVLPLKYPSAQLFSDGLFNLVITKKQYNAWWRFWQWKLMPEFNILSTSSHGPFLVTKVPKAKWAILSIPDKKVLFSQKRMENIDNTQYWKKDWYPDQQVPPDMQISSAGNALKVRDHLFVLNTKLKKASDDVLELLNDTNALVFKKGEYTLLDISGRSTEKKTYVIQDAVQFQVDKGVVMDVKKQSKELYPYPTIAAFILKGNDGRTYLSPDLSKPFPLHVEDYNSRTAAEIMTQVITIASIPGSPYFLIVAVLGENKERTCLLLDSNGKWNTDIPAYEGLDQMLNNGDLLFTRGSKKGVLTRDLDFKELPLDYHASPLSFSKGLYSGKDIVTQLYGVYNTSTEEWQVSPKYSFIGNEIVPGVCVYTEIRNDENGTRKEYYGLLNIKTNQLITTARYNMINNDGLAGITENGQPIYFYINPETGKEYRE
jgi:hypothetical protein